MISWGLVATAMGFVAGETSFYALRFALGVAEAGFFPGIILFLTYWFPRESRARIVSLFMTAVPIATVVGGPLSCALLGLHGLGGVSGWRWLFIIEGIPAVLLGIVALRFLTDRSKDAQWLAPEERTALERRLEAEAEDTASERLCRHRPGAHQSACDRARPALFLPRGRGSTASLLDASGA
jgi:MFS transporter, ACS family, tartrate transporter